MKLRFQVNQAAAFRRGIDAHTSIVDLEVDPASLEQTRRDQIAARLVDGIKVHPLQHQGTMQDGLRHSHALIEANDNTLEGLLAAIDENLAAIAEEDLRRTKDRAQQQRAREELQEEPINSRRDL